MPTSSFPFCAAAGAPGLIQSAKEAFGIAGESASDAAARTRGAAEDTAQATVDKMRETGEVGRGAQFSRQSVGLGKVQGSVRRSCKLRHEGCRPAGQSAGPLL